MGLAEDVDVAALHPRREKRRDGYAEAKNTALRSRQAEIEAEIAALRKEVHRLRAAEFWDRVMREVASVLLVSGTMSAEDIVRRLPPTLAQ